VCSSAHDAAGRVTDPVCGMSVDLERARELGLTIAYQGTSFGFCGRGCLSAFEADPGGYALAATKLHSHVGGTAGSDAVARGETAVPHAIDEGMRRWYEACSCCLSDAYPEVKAVLDAERAAAAQPLAWPGICEVAEAAV